MSAIRSLMTLVIFVLAFGHYTGWWSHPKSDGFIVDSDSRITYDNPEAHQTPQISKTASVPIKRLDLTQLTLPGWSPFLHDSRLFEEAYESQFQQDRPPFDHGVYMTVGPSLNLKKVEIDLHRVSDPTRPRRKVILAIARVSASHEAIAASILVTARQQAPYTLLAPAYRDGVIAHLKTGRYHPAFSCSCDH